MLYITFAFLRRSASSLTRTFRLFSQMLSNSWSCPFRLFLSYSMCQWEAIRLNTLLEHVSLGGNQFDIIFDTIVIQHVFMLASSGMMLCLSWKYRGYVMSAYLQFGKCLDSIFWCVFYCIKASLWLSTTYFHNYYPWKVSCPKGSL